jgi:acyl carrier protein phosphodiesterase
VNHLAHCFLAGPDPELVVGSLLGDFWRGPLDPAWPPRLARGVRLHRSVDSWTDSHPSTLLARRRFEPPFRRYAGILLDVWFDHLLARDFARWSGSESLRAFADRCHAVLLRAVDGPTPFAWPPAFALYVHRLAQYDGLVAYAEAAHAEAVLDRIGLRLSRPSPLGAAMPVLESLQAPLQRDFEALMPALVAYARSEAHHPVGAASAAIRGASDRG